MKVADKNKPIDNNEIPSANPIRGLINPSTRGAVAPTTNAKDNMIPVAVAR